MAIKQRNEEEREYMGKLSRYARRMAINNLPAMQGEWRKKPYALRDYTPIDNYVPVEVMDFFIENDGFCIENDGFCIENDAFCRG